MSECRLIEAELEGITPQELDGAFRSLCGSLLAQTLTILRQRAIRRKDEICEKRNAREWLAGNTGVISFDEVCDCLGIDESRTRDAVRRYAESRGRSPISRAVFGALTHDCNIG